MLSSNQESKSFTHRPGKKNNAEKWIECHGTTHSGTEVHSMQALVIRPGQRGLVRLRKPNKHSIGTFSLHELDELEVAVQTARGLLLATIVS